MIWSFRWCFVLYYIALPCTALQNMCHAKTSPKTLIITLSMS